MNEKRESPFFKAIANVTFHITRIFKDGDTHDKDAPF
jgi:hypothetical protein